MLWHALQLFVVRFVQVVILFFLQYTYIVLSCIQFIVFRLMLMSLLLLSCFINAKKCQTYSVLWFHILFLFFSFVVCSHITFGETSQNHQKKTYKTIAFVFVFANCFSCCFCCVFVQRIVFLFECHFISSNLIA